ncbi:FAST kinase domain-containing protein 2, mitochondrial-like [Toxorhynchites rutilus septentrionalis]|uniref:FAST kinase domain-containing protein 2, mitochondrial-like n=1 Tax=Toxorhynchites rutilus septentrionalis TaxID=329112 RepID=UPI00247AC6E7|nr:FAST kinase domain-containing protein 2, mitochondrial-like [Toxorhynchites rutilus septentrionalis]XP_055641629.1 FAST kinase domain-containing protein 2, mitochondrial-like [Toxorhynchites rutilus septentrionalis]
MLRGIISQVTRIYGSVSSVNLIKRISTIPSLTSATTFNKEPLSTSINQVQTDSYLNLLRQASDAKEVLEFLPTLDKRKLDRQAVTLAALKALFELHKNGKTTMQRTEVLNHPRFAELCKALKYDSRFLIVNDITESLKILTYFGVGSSSEIVTILLHLLRHQINDINLDHIVFLNFILTKMDRSPLIEALLLALPMLFQIQIAYKMDHENIQQLVDLLGFISKHRVSDRCVMNVVSALTLHGTNLSGMQAADALKALTEFSFFEPQYLKLLENIFIALTERIDEVNFKTIDFIMKKIVDKNLEKYPMFYNEDYFRRCAQFIVDHNIGLLNALYFQKKFNKIGYLHVPLLDYIASRADNLSIVTNSGIITIVGAFANANYKPPNWEQVKPEISRHSLLTSSTIPWIRYNLELLSLDIYNSELLKHYLDSSSLEKSMARNATIDYLQILQLTQTLQLLHPEYDGPLPDRRYLEKAIALLLENSDLPLLKPLELTFGGEGSVLTQVTSEYGHVLDYVVVFDQNGSIVKQPRNSEEDRTATKIEELKAGGNQIITIICLAKICYALNVNRLRGQYALHLKTIETLGVSVVPISYQLWSNLPEAERIPFLEREVRAKLK